MLALFEFNKIWVIIYLLFVLGISLEGGTRKIGWLWSAFLALVLTPIGGFIIIMFSPKRTSPNPRQSSDVTYTCKKCGFGVIEPREKCLICGEPFPIRDNLKNGSKLKKSTSA